MTFFELAQSLLRGYLDSSDLPVEVVFAGEKHQQWSAGPYTVSVTETGATTTLINLVRKSETKTAVVDWAEWGIEPDCEVSAQLRRRFADFLDEKFFPQLTSDRQDRRDPNDRTEQKPGPDQQNILPRRLEKVRPTGPERPPDMPDFDDEYELKDTHRPAAAPPALVGDRDLYPAGLPRHPEMKPYLDPLADGPRGGMTIWTIWEWDCPVVFADPDRVLVAQVLGPDRDLGSEDSDLDPEEQDSAGPDLDFERWYFLY
ncbi:PI31 proteasome regulator family protein [Clavispora lusitaniae]|uniref:PI31 proteasome regulator family protein n=1 Tax=Clavispora lusitaniae TaxID=36911 RepID=UPI00202C2BB8|nr:PI31 proteasome regulator family protein [Clavispora lusitaniae]